MAIYLYGYIIERGKTLIDPDAASRIEAFIRNYLSGSSIQEAIKRADIPLSRATVSKLIKNEAYLGNDYYPALISEKTFTALQEEYRKRTHKGKSVPAQPIPAKNRFILSPPPVEKKPGAAAETAELIYSLIVPAENGRTKAAGSSIAVLRRWIAKAEPESKERSLSWQ